MGLARCLLVTRPSRCAATPLLAYICEADAQEQGSSLMSPLFPQRRLERKQQQLPSATLTERA
jgi:hypothetical protein